MWSPKMMVKDNNGSDALTIPLDLARCMIHFRHRIPPSDEIITSNVIFNKGDATWNSSSIFDQVADKFNQ
jgi:hypothetical protein